MRFAWFVFVLLAAVSAQGAWMDSNYEDFLQGSYDAEIYVSRRLDLEADPADSGCVEYHARFDVNNDGWYDLISPGKYGPLKVWLGSSTGYSPSNYLSYTISMGGDCDVSDLNVDGYAELIHSGVYDGYASIYWGTPSGPSPDDTTLLPNDSAEAVYVADFDKDTYVDVAIPGVWQYFYIYWGSASGYSASNRYETVIGNMPHNMEASDLDKNGYLDAIVLRLWAPNDVVILYQDSPRTFRMDSLAFSGVISPHGLSIGDFDRNGYTDIVATGYSSILHSCVYWGRQSGFDAAERLTLNPGQCYGGSAVADFNGDGWLDILYLRSHNQRPKIYYNLGAEPYFSEANTEEIGIPVFATAGVVADFDYDGDLDVFINHEGPYSYVFYGPTYATCTMLPVDTDHHGTFREPGQVGSYYSRVASPCSVGADTLVVGGSISWIALTPGDSKVAMFLRAGDTPVPDSLWTDWYQVDGDSASGVLPEEVCGHRYLQYRGDLVWGNPAELPRLERVELELSCGNNDTLCRPIEPWTPRTQGYWRRQCKDRPHEDICAYVDSVHALADLFDAFDCDSICGLMNVEPPENDMCRKARRQFMALLLNVASGKLAVCNCLEDGREVGDVISDIDSILSGHAGHAPCEHAKTLADDLNNGKGIVVCDGWHLQVPPKVASPAIGAPAPNPFTYRTVLEYEIPYAEIEKVSVYDCTGRLVRTLTCAEDGTSMGRAEWDGLDEEGSRVPSGVYFFRIDSGEDPVSRAVIKLR